jgi:uncharacterized protein (DUF305 family)
VSTRNLTLSIAAVLVAAIAIITITSSGGGDSTADAKATDGAFVVEMIPHHESAIEMAEIAARRGEHAEVRELAEQIASSQATEIGALERAHERLFGQPASDGSHGTLGLPADEMGMHMDASGLAGEKPFDKAFIDMMVPHHQGAIRMARIELAQGEDPRLSDIAEAIIDAQTAEIAEMNRWRTDWYGAPSPAGGVPAEEEATTPSHEEMGH